MRVVLARAVVPRKRRMKARNPSLRSCFGFFHSGGVVRFGFVGCCVCLRI